MRFAFCSLFFILALALALPALAEDEVRYVKENFKISVRGNPSEKAEAWGVLTAGDKVTVTKISGGWSYVKSPSIEGWVSTALLVDNQPSVAILDEIRTENEKLKTENAEALSELEQLRNENANLKQLQDKSNDQTRAFITLMEKTNNDLPSLVTLKEDYDKLQQELSGKTKRLESLEKSASRDVFYTYLRWFFSGAGVLVVGFLIGVITRKSNNRRYY